MTDFAIHAAALGNLSGFYFYSYVAMQVPTGILADRWGPRKLLTLGCAVATLGTLLFALAPNILWASAGRLLIGGSVAVAFVALLKLSAHWLPQKRYALASGLALCIGVTGAVFAGVPLRLLVDAFGWRSTMAFSALFTLIVCALIWLYVRDDPSEKGWASHHPNPQGSAQATIGIWAGVRRAFTYRNILLLLWVPGGIVGPLLAFAGLWGVPFLQTHYDMPATSAAAYCSLLMIAWAVGGPLFGWLSDHLGRRKPIYVASALILLVCWVSLFWHNDWSAIMLGVLLTTIGLVSGVMVISFAFARESAPSALTGTVSGLINMGVMMGPMIMQPAVGVLLDRLWQGDLSEGVRVYTFDAFQSAFFAAIAWLAISTVLIAFTRETHCRRFPEAS